MFDFGNKCHRVFDIGFKCELTAWETTLTRVAICVVASILQRAELDVIGQTGLQLVVVAKQDGVVSPSLGLTELHTGQCVDGVFAESLHVVQLATGSPVASLGI